MPRIENSGPTVDVWCKETGEGSSTVDVCMSCYDAFDGEFDGGLFDPDGHGEPTGEVWEGEVAHPPYDESDYRCAYCREPLTGEDD